MTAETTINVTTHPNSIKQVTAHLKSKTYQDHAPQHEHDCDRCVFIKNGLVAGGLQDWWLCPSAVAPDGGSLIARFGVDGDYASFPVETILGWDTRPGYSFGGTNPTGFVQQGKLLLTELGYQMVDKRVVLDLGA